MSGKIEVCTRRGASRDRRYCGYPEWYLKVTGEDGTETQLSPTFLEVRGVLKNILVHEYRNDVTRFRRPDFMKKLKMLILSDQLFAEAQLDFETYDIPEIYLKTNITVDGKQKFITKDTRSQHDTIHH